MMYKVDDEGYILQDPVMQVVVMGHTEDGRLIVRPYGSPCRNSRIVHEDQFTRQKKA